MLLCVQAADVGPVYRILELNLKGWKTKTQRAGPIKSVILTFVPSNIKTLSGKRFL